MRRVLTAPGRGALAKTMTAVPSDFVITHCELARIGPQPVSEPQAPHEQDGAHHAVLLPAASRRGQAVLEAQRRPEALESLAEGEVLHQRDIRVAARGREERAGREDCLVS